MTPKRYLLCSPLALALCAIAFAQHSEPMAIKSGVGHEVSQRLQLQLTAATTQIKSESASEPIVAAVSHAHALSAPSSPNSSIVTKTAEKPLETGVHKPVINPAMTSERSVPSKPFSSEARPKAQASNNAPATETVQDDEATTVLNESALALNEAAKVNRVEPLTASSRMPNSMLDSSANAQPQYLSQPQSKAAPVSLSKADYASAPTPPTYPKLARKRGLEGTVQLEVFFNHYGQAQSLSVLTSSGHRVLDEAALAAVKTWHFLAPNHLSAGLFRVEVPVRFALN
ncbi:TonB family protein [Shewanella sp. SNU WT4]|uniref:energy transducer TonB n=1 Tax=Shewanella sp. SNU WT4 TaxID=2590015 RepID=UPI00112D9ACD|nr:energy transducer TonB [Shewanella sp. SNU WT4]QDF66165.1 TonB family protein [Shewanella sp. SNU WT4]